MSKPRYPTAVEQEKATLAAKDNPAVEGFVDPLAQQLADQPQTVKARQPKLKHLGGSASDDFNIFVANGALQTSWFTDKDKRGALIAEIGYALAGIGPKDEIEGMLAAQMVGAHQAAMESFRRAMIQNQTVDGRAMNLSQANKASRTYGMLLETLNRHRSKGQQKVIVEHVHRHIHVHENGRAIDGEAPTPGDGAQLEKRSQPHAQAAVGYAIEPSLRGEDEEREPVQRAGDAEREMPDARRRKPRRANG